MEINGIAKDKEKSEDTEIENKEIKAEKEGLNELEETLKDNIKQFLKSANSIYKAGDYTSATILFFKALFSVLDLIILKEKGFIPKDHSKRFRVLQENFGEFYGFVDSNFEIYQNTCNSKVNKFDCDKIKEYVERIIKEQKI